MDQHELLVDGRPVGSVVIARTLKDRSKGLLGRDGLAGALLLQPCSSVHTARMRFSLDVAFLDGDLRVRAVRTLRPWRLSRPRPRTQSVLEAEAGAFAIWGLAPGAQLDTRPVETTLGA